MSDPTICTDCHVLPGQPHDDGCDVARCTECGVQRIGCEHGSQDVGWGQIWTGEYPSSGHPLEGVWDRETQRWNLFSEGWRP